MLNKAKQKSKAAFSIIFFILFLLNTGTLFSFSFKGAELSPDPSIVVMPFYADVIEAMNRTDIYQMRNIAENTFSRVEIFNIIPYQDFLKYLNDNNIQAANIYNLDVVSKINEAGVDLFITAEVVVHTYEYVVTLYMVNTHSLSYIDSEPAVFRKSGRELQNGMIAFVERFCATVEFVNSYSRVYSNEPLYKIGDTGPAGGIIFFIKPKNSGAWRYLEAAPFDIIGTAPWGGVSEGVWSPNIKGTLEDVGEGRRNTAMLSAAFEIFDHLLPAALQCAALEYNNYKDWFLPSKDELNLLYRNLAAKDIGHFNGISYWSSTQSTDGTAWFQRFDDGRQYPNGIKSELLNIRAIRAFR